VPFVHVSTSCITVCLVVLIRHELVLSLLLVITFYNALALSSLKSRMFVVNCFADGVPDRLVKRSSVLTELYITVVQYDYDDGDNDDK